MTLSRRNFLGVAAGFPAALLSARNLGAELLSRPGEDPGGLLLLDFEGDCSLPESLAGFEATLRAANVPFQWASVGTREVARMLIAPAATFTDYRDADWLRTRLEEGATVLFESGAAFLPPHEFVSQQRRVQEHFGVSINSPLRIWEEPEAWSRVPYLDYTWPLRTKVRDFSLVVPVSSQGSEVVASLGQIPVGLRKRIGGGTLFFLGSPIGPHLLTGDQQAERWLSEFCTQA
jgi:hypothetical protein